MRLNEDQQEALEALAAVKRQVDSDMAQRKANYEAGLMLDRAPLYDAVAQADKLRVPARQIGFVLGTSDHKTIKSYFPDKEK